MTQFVEMALEPGEDDGHTLFDAGKHQRKPIRERSDTAIL